MATCDLNVGVNTIVGLVVNQCHTQNIKTVGSICVISERLKSVFLSRGQLQNQYSFYIRKDWIQWEKLVAIQRAWARAVHKCHLTSQGSGSTQEHSKIFQCLMEIMGSESQPWSKKDLSSKWTWPCPSAQGGFCWANPGAAPSAQPFHPPEFPLLMLVRDISLKPIIIHSKLTWLSFGRCHRLMDKWYLSHRNAHTLLKKERVTLEPQWMQKVLFDIGEVVCYLKDWQFRQKRFPLFFLPQKSTKYMLFCGFLD